MKILFIGCVQSSYVFLDALIEYGADIVGVITKKESSFNADFMDLTPLCKKADIPYLFVNNINESGAVDFIERLKPDIGYCLGWSQLIHENVISMFPKGVVGYHPTMLPNNRGRHPIIWTLVLGLTETASSFFIIDQEADTGNIVSQCKVAVEYEDNAETLMNKLLRVGENQIVNLTKDFENETVNVIKQEKKEGNSWRKRGKMDGQIDWRMSSRAIYNLVRALTKPYVGAHFLIDDKEIKVWNVKEHECTAGEYGNVEPGKVVCVSSESFTVKTGDNLIEVLACDDVEIHLGDYL